MADKNMEFGRAPPRQAFFIGEEADLKSDARTRKRFCARCCGITCCLLLLLVIIIIILAFTVFKVKKAQIVVDHLTLQSFSASLHNFIIPSVNLTLGLGVSVTNPNKASFRYFNSTSLLLYHGEEVGFLPIPAGEIGAGATESIAVSLTIMADHLITNSNLLPDFLSGSLPLSTTTVISGRVTILHFIKHHVETSTTCNITISIASRAISNSQCDNKIQL